MLPSALSVRRGKKANVPSTCQPPYTCYISQYQTWVGSLPSCPHATDMDADAPRIVCLPRGPRAKGCQSQEHTSTAPPFYSQHKDHAPPTAMPTFWEEEDALAHSFQFLYLVSGQSPTSGGIVHVHQDSGSQPLQQCSWQDWKPGLLQHTPGFPTGAMQALVSQGSQGDGRKGTGLCQGCPSQNPWRPPLCSVAMFSRPGSGDPITGVGSIQPHTTEWGWVPTQSPVLISNFGRGIYF